MGTLRLDTRMSSDTPRHRHLRADHVEAIGATAYRYMRVHDSGDLFSAAYTRAWIRICSALSWVRFWFPTRSWLAPWLEVIKQPAALPNVTVRPSAIHFDDEPPQIDGSYHAHFERGTDARLLAAA
jgi:Gene product 88